MRVGYNEVYLSSWTKGKQVGIWDFKGKEGNSQEDEKEQVSVHKCLLGHTETTGHRILTDFAVPPRPPHLVHTVLCLLSHSVMFNSSQSHGL